MELDDILRSRRMVRDFTDEPVAPEVLEHILESGLRAPSAGNTGAARFLVLTGRDQTQRFWSATFDASGQDPSRFAWPGMFRAPVLIVVWSHRQAYLDRYAEPDKAAAVLGRDPATWPVPYWDVDAGFAALLMLLKAVDSGLGALFFGIFAPEAVRAAFGVPSGYAPVGGLAVGHPGPGANRRSSSTNRPRPRLEEAAHRGRW